MRVISGLRKGHKLKTPKGTDVRPTEDRVKESLFNILNIIDENSIILDGFAGSGSIGIEFLSRGAKLAYFVDKSSESIKSIEENLIHTKFKDNSVVIKKDLSLMVKDFKRDNIKFDYIYLDPPFNQLNLVKNILNDISINEILNNNGKIIIEHEKELELENNLYDFEKTDYRKYGSKVVTFYKKVNQEETDESNLSRKF